MAIVNNFDIQGVELQVMHAIWYSNYIVLLPHRGLLCEKQTRLMNFSEKLTEALRLHLSPLHWS